MKKKNQVFKKEVLPSRHRALTGSVTLLEKAVAYDPLYPISHGVGNENYELALAWVRGEITTSQAGAALGHIWEDEFGVQRHETMKTYARMASWLREAHKRSKLDTKATGE